MAAAAACPKYVADAGDALCGLSAATAAGVADVCTAVEPVAGFFDLAAAAIGGSAPIWLHVRTNMANGLVLESNCNA